MAVARSIEASAALSARKPGVSILGGASRSPRVDARASSRPRVSARRVARDCSRLEAPVAKREPFRGGGYHVLHDSAVSIITRSHDGNACSDAGMSGFYASGQRLGGSITTDSQYSASVLINSTCWLKSAGLQM